MREDRSTNTPEDAADWHRHYAPADDGYDVDKPGPHDLPPAGPARPGPSIVDLTKSALLAGNFAPRPLGLIDHMGVCVFVTRPSDDIDAMAACLRARGLEARLVDATFHVLRRDPIDGRAVGGPYPDPPF